MAINVTPDMSKVVEWSRYLEMEDEDIEEARLLYEEAKDFLIFYDWCGEIRETYVGMFYPGILAIYLFRITPLKEGVDDWVWVVVGDIPAAYLTVDECPNPATALDGYIGALEEWVDAAKNGKSVANIIPVNVPATKENADMLEKRLVFLDDRILYEYRDDLRDNPEHPKK